MKFTLPATLLAVAVSAQSTSVSTSTTCAAANIVDACLDTTNGYLAQCTDNADYQCKCDKYTAIMTCFNNCPNDSRASSYANSKQLYCMNASLYSSATAQPTTTGSASAPVSAPATTTTAANKVGAAATSASSSAVAKSTDAAKNGAAEMLANTSGLMLAVAAIIAAVL
ncbi:CFEM domain protein [Apiospora kogelbergensis]|uniref:CFEM domain protein n=1 Tax=Apiospora kogelbergensis TaxID=1337665 RepID=A0AAW0R053_9PEZI